MLQAIYKDVQETVFSYISETKRACRYIPRTIPDYPTNI